MANPSSADSILDGKALFWLTGSSSIACSPIHYLTFGFIIHAAFVNNKNEEETLQGQKWDNFQRNSNKKSNILRKYYFTTENILDFKISEGLELTQLLGVAICSLQSTIYNLLSTFCNLQSTIYNLHSAIYKLQSAICMPGHDSSGSSCPEKKSPTVLTYVINSIDITS